MSMITPPSSRATVCRAPQQACYELETIYAIIDEAFFCHIAFSTSSGGQCVNFMKLFQFGTHCVPN